VKHICVPLDVTKRKKKKIIETFSKALQISDSKTRKVYTGHYLYAKWHGKARRNHKFSTI